MCTQCSGNGKQYKEVFPGAWQLTPCSCVEFNEEEWRINFQAFIERLRNKREKSTNAG